jgi:hypothetical protein
MSVLTILTDTDCYCYHAHIALHYATHRPVQHTPYVAAPETVDSDDDESVTENGVTGENWYKVVEVGAGRRVTSATAANGKILYTYSMEPLTAFDVLYATACGSVLAVL